MGPLNVALEYPIETLVSSTTFLTTISFILVVLSPWTYKYVHLLALTLVVLMGSLYVTVLGPAKYVVPIETCDGHKELVWQGFDLYIYDVVAHVAPFAFVWVVYGNYYMACDRMPLLIGTGLMIIIYTLVFDMKAKYVLTTQDLNALYGIGAFAFGVMYLSCHS